MSAQTVQMRGGQGIDRGVGKVRPTLVPTEEVNRKPTLASMIFLSRELRTSTFGLRT